MIRRHPGAAVLAVVLAAALTGCANLIAGTATWPGARLEKAVLTAADFPPGAQYDPIVPTPGQPDGVGGPTNMLSVPEGCSDGLTRAIADSAERGAGSAAEYVVGYDGARIVMTVLTWPLDLARLAATADRCAHFQAFFDRSAPGIPMTTTKLATQRSDALAYQQRLLLLRERRQDGRVRHRVSHTESLHRRQSLAAADVSGHRGQAGRPRWVGLTRALRQ
jgi:hypothetical protein